MWTIIFGGPINSKIDVILLILFLIYNFCIERQQRSFGLWKFENTSSKTKGTQKEECFQKINEKLPVEAKFHHCIYLQYVCSLGKGQ